GSPAFFGSFAASANSRAAFARASLAFSSLAFSSAVCGAAGFCSPSWLCEKAGAWHAKKRPLAKATAKTRTATGIFGNSGRRFPRLGGAYVTFDFVIIAAPRKRDGARAVKIFGWVRLRGGRQPA